jgi:hypothetical protein
MDRSKNLGLSNFYLKVGVALVVASLTAIAFTSFFSVDRELQSAVRGIGGLTTVSGAVIYFIGRFVQFKRARAQA